MLDKPHSFGGSRMDRHIFEFDPDDEVGGDYDDTVAALSAAGDGAEAGAEASAAEPSAEATPPEVDEAPSSSPSDEAPAPAWVPDENDFRTLQERQDALIQYLASQETANTAPDAEAPEMPQMLDPDYEAKLATYLDWRDEQRDRVWQERFNQVAPVVQSVQEKEAAAQKDSIIDSLDVDGFEKEKPEFREGAEFFAVGLIDSVKAELGLPLDQPSARAAQVALQRGAEKFTAFARAQREAGKAAYIAEMEALGNAPKDLSVTGGGREGAAETDDYDEALRRFMGASA